jgi:hypothetical protein
MVMAGRHEATDFGVFSHLFPPLTMLSPEEPVALPNAI